MNREGSVRKRKISICESMRQKKRFDMDKERTGGWWCREKTKQFGESGENMSLWESDWSCFPEVIKVYGTHTVYQSTCRLLSSDTKPILCAPLPPSSRVALIKNICWFIFLHWYIQSPPLPHKMRTDSLIEMHLNANQMLGVHSSSRLKYIAS